MPALNEVHAKTIKASLELFAGKRGNFAQRLLKYFCWLPARDQVLVIDDDGGY